MTKYRSEVSGEGWLSDPTRIGCFVWDRTRGWSGEGATGQETRITLLLFPGETRTGERRTQGNTAKQPLPAGALCHPPPPHLPPPHTPGSLPDPGEQAAPGPWDAAQEGGDNKSLSNSM